MVDWPPVLLKQKHKAFSTLSAITMLCFDVGERRRRRRRGGERRGEERKGGEERGETGTKLNQSHFIQFLILLFL